MTILLRINMEKKERTRNLYLKFKEPLSNKVLAELSKERKFYAKYSVFEPVMVGNVVNGLIIEDSFNVNYSVDLDSITARSFTQSDDFVLKKLKIMGERIIDIFDLEKDCYELIEGEDFKYVNDFSLEDSLNLDLIQKIKKEFNEEEEPLLAQIKFIVKKSKGTKIINLVYDNPKNYEDGRLLIEADKEYLTKVLKAIDKDD